MDFAGLAKRHREELRAKDEELKNLNTKLRTRIKERDQEIIELKKKVLRLQVKNNSRVMEIEELKSREWTFKGVEIKKARRAYD